MKNKCLARARQHLFLVEASIARGRKTKKPIMASKAVPNPQKKGPGRDPEGTQADTSRLACSRKRKKQTMAPKAIPNHPKIGPERDPGALNRTQIVPKSDTKACRGVPAGCSGTP